MADRSRVIVLRSERVVVEPFRTNPDYLLHGPRMDNGEYDVESPIYGYDGNIPPERLTCDRTLMRPVHIVVEGIVRYTFPIGTPVLLTIRRVPDDSGDFDPVAVLVVPEGAVPIPGAYSEDPEPMVASPSGSSPRVPPGTPSFFPSPRGNSPGPNDGNGGFVIRNAGLGGRRRKTRRSRKSRANRKNRKTRR